MSYTVYKHTSPAGKVYIGCTRQKTQRRWGSGGYRYKDNTEFWADIQHYGWDAFQHEVVAEGLTIEDAERLEVEMIAKHQSTDPLKGYNKGPGGENLGRNFHHTADARYRIRAASTGRHPGASTRQKLSEARKGWNPSPETRARMAEASKGRPSPNKGKKPAAETLERLRNAAERKPVKNLDTGEIYPSIQGAARSTGLHAGAIWAACNGKQKTHGGFRWAYEEVIR